MVHVLRIRSIGISIVLAASREKSVLANDLRFLVLIYRRLNRGPYSQEVHLRALEKSLDVCIYIGSC